MHFGKAISCNWKGRGLAAHLFNSLRQSSSPQHPLNEATQPSCLWVRAEREVQSILSRKSQLVQSTQQSPQHGIRQTSKQNQSIQTRTASNRHHGRPASTTFAQFLHH